MYNAQFVSALKEALNGLRTIHSVGEEWCSYIGQIPTGGVPYCGQEVTRSTYSALWSYAQAQGLVKSESEWQSIASAQGGNVPFYSSGNGSTTFRMPKIVGYVKGASSQSESGSYVAEGLPSFDHYHIQGGVTPSGYSMRYGVTDTKMPGVLFDTGTAVSGTLGMHTSGVQNQNGIYGNSSHVTPETSCVLFGVYAFGEVNNVDALDAGTLASALARVESNLETKVDKTSAHIIETWSDGTNWYRKYSDGWVEQGGTLPATQSALTFHVEFKDTNYYVTDIAMGHNNNMTPHAFINPSSKTTTGATLLVCQYGGAASTSANMTHAWEAKGYAK